MIDDRSVAAKSEDQFADAVRLHQAGLLADAERGYRQLLQSDPDHADAMHLLGLIAFGAGQADVAARWIRRAIGLNRTVPDYRSNLGLALQDRGLHHEAAASYRAALCLKPDFAEIYYNLGNALKNSRRGSLAIAAYQVALRVNPDFAQAHCNLGIVLHGLRQLDETVAAYRTALCLTPDVTEAYANLGMALYEQGCLDDAITAVVAALRLKPDFVQAQSTLGNALKDLGRCDEAIATFDQALRLQPDHADAHSSLLMCQHYHPAISAQTILETALRFGRQVETAVMAPAHAVSSDPDRRLRIGYVSGNFHRHPVGYFLRRVLDNHDPTSVEIFCYSNFSRADDLTTRLQESSDHWRSLVGLSDQAAADLIIADGIDILVDLSGHTAHNRLSLFARKPAPIQVTWLGFWGTTGLSRMDYILSDAVMIPPGEERFYSEIVLRLPHGRFCYDPPDYAPAPVPPPALRGSPITFGSFNNLAKIGPDVVGLWSEILRAVPRSRLLLKWQTFNDPRMRRRVTDAFSANAIDSERLDLRGASPHEAMLAEYGDIDIALDPFPFSGGLTSCEALWMGVPVVTLPGTSAASRQTGGILKNLGLNDWIADSPSDYVKIVSTLAGDLPRLARRRAELRDLMAGSPLCDGKSFTIALEQVFREMWRCYCATGAAPGTTLHGALSVLQARAAEALRHHQAGRLTEAVTAYGAVLSVKPDYAEAHSNLGTALKELGRFGDAAAACCAALSLKPDYAKAYYNRGNALKSLGRLNEAVTAFGRAMIITPGLVAAHYNMGNALKALNRLDEAVAVYDAALRLKPDTADAHSNRGNALQELGRLTEAVAAYRVALCLQPDHADAFSNLGNSLKGLGHLTEAAAACRVALTVNPSFAEAHYNLGLIFLLTGRLEAGWPKYEWRGRVNKLSLRRRDFPEPQWQGEPLAGKTILLHAEQGLGDSIQFCRYAPMLAEQGARVILEVQRPLRRLLSGLAGVDRVLAAGDPLPDFDYHCPLLSLPQAFDTRVETIPGAIPYLAAEPESVVLWRHRLPPSPLRIGVAWQGSPTYRDDRTRSIPLADFAPLARLSGVCLISLQKHHGLEQLVGLPKGMTVETLKAFDEGSDAFIDAAAVMMNLDLTVTVDTALAHLAGALGRPVWVPLATSPHWVWQLDRDDTPWYPTMRLFRQTSRGQWHDVFDRMAVALAAMMKHSVRQA